MKLSKEQVGKISAMILDDIKGKGLVVFKADEGTVLKKIADVFTANLLAEDALEREVEEILKDHAEAMDSTRVDYRRMFHMVKQKLAKERGIVI
ncbi:MAG: DUF507 family protein [Deltaproteobacteria bacterium]|nr:DUF507 family protein [Deltaproteobacteria bacterium]